MAATTEPVHAARRLTLGHQSAAFDLLRRDGGGAAAEGRAWGVEGVWFTRDEAAGIGRGRRGPPFAQLTSRFCGFRSAPAHARESR